MKTKLLFLSFMLVSFVMTAQVVANQVDDFEDGTVQGWIINGSGFASNPPLPFNVATDGPSGVDDNFLRYETTGSPGGAGSKMIIINQAGNWTGNYTSQGVVAIKMDVRATDNDLHVRVAFDGAGGIFCTTDAVVVPAGSGWQSVTIPISPAGFTPFGGSDINATLGDVTIMRILSRTTPGWIGDAIDATMDLDNITASTTLGTTEVNQIGFEISPNPASSKLNIKLPQSSMDATVAVYDVLGKRVYSKSLNTMVSSIDVSKWNSGVYLVRISSNNGTISKRFVKQ
ncbi:T9SS type A sorting domain-containing protein [Psychroserpens sp. BH13MA-6]